ncbi:hypothetical protein [Sphingomonas sp. PB4P5]|uniref:hypothetical protein n=1 Tax=Parasphingomonas puruogangriensis TaxID=3096155 RepID=UPI002FCB1AAE
MSMVDCSSGHRFDVRGSASPDFPSRVLDLFAQRSLRFDRVVIIDRGDVYALIIRQRGLTWDQATILLHKMRAMVVVASAELRAI